MLTKKVHGRITDQNNRRIAGARIVLLDQDRHSHHDTMGYGTTNADGKYSIPYRCNEVYPHTGGGPFRTKPGRPTIYILIYAQLFGETSWSLVGRSTTHADSPPRDLRIDKMVRIPKKHHDHDEGMAEPKEHRDHGELLPVEPNCVARVEITQDELADIQQLAAKHDVEIEVSNTLTGGLLVAILSGVAFAVTLILHQLQARRGGQIIDMRCTPTEFRRDKNLMYGLVVLTLNDGTVKIQVREARSSLGLVVDAITEMTVELATLPIAAVVEKVAGAVGNSATVEEFHTDDSSAKVSGAVPEAPY